MLDPRSIATLGVGYGPRHVAALGLWPADVVVPVPLTMSSTGTGGGAVRKRKRKRPIEEDEAIVLGFIG